MFFMARLPRDWEPKKTTLLVTGLNTLTWFLPLVMLTSRPAFSSATSNFLISLTNSERDLWTRGQMKAFAVRTLIGPNWNANYLIWIRLFRNCDVADSLLGLFCMF